MTLGTVLLDRAAAACDMLERVFASQDSFDPAVEEREFVMLASDYAVAVYGTRLACEVSARAPGIRLVFRRVPATVAEGTAALLSAVDGLFMPHGVISGPPAIDLFSDTWLCVVADDNPEVGASITLGQLGALPWAVYQRVLDASVGRQLSALGIEPRPGVRRQLRAPARPGRGNQPRRHGPRSPRPAPRPWPRGGGPPSALPVRCGPGQGSPLVAPGPCPRRGPPVAAETAVRAAALMPESAGP